LYTNTVPPLHLLSTASSAGGMDKVGEIRSLSNKSATWETTAREDSVRHAAQVTVSFKPTKYVNKPTPSTLRRLSTGALYSNPFSNTNSSTRVSAPVSTLSSTPSSTSVCFFRYGEQAGVVLYGDDDRWVKLVIEGMKTPGEKAIVMAVQVRILHTTVSLAILDASHPRC
jgi:hypothetical protein